MLLLAPFGRCAAIIKLLTPDVFTVFLNKDDDDDDDDVIGSTFVGSTQIFVFRAACVIGSVSSLGYLDAPRYSPPLPTRGAYPCH